MATSRAKTHIGRVTKVAMWVMISPTECPSPFDSLTRLGAGECRPYPLVNLPAFLAEAQVYVGPAMVGG
jgi:hypothetical protein